MTNAGAAEEPPGAGTLYVVSTPIGNMGDLSFRAVEILQSVALVLAEDTRHTRHLLERYQIATPSASYHEHNEAKTTPGLVARLLGGETMALVSDAGTPLLSDPGARLTAAAIEAGVRVVPVPGASALLAALVASGLDAARFTFFGFLARSGSERRTTLHEIGSLAHTSVLYEAPSRVADTLAAIEAVGGAERQAAVAREMTKQFEEVRRGTVGSLRAYYEGRPARGEVVLVIGGARRVDPTEEQVRERVRALRSSGMSARDTAAQVASELGVSKRVAYQLAQDRTAGGASTRDEDHDQE